MTGDGKPKGNLEIVIYIFVLSGLLYSLPTLMFTVIEKFFSSFSFHWSSTRPAPQISCQAFSPAASDLLQSSSYTEGVHSSRH